MLDSLVRVSRRVPKVPKAKASPTGDSGSVRGYRRRQRDGPAVGTRSDRRTTVRARDGPDAKSGGPSPRVYRRAWRVGTRGSGGYDGCRSRRAPPRPSDPPPTGRDVLRGEKCTRSTCARTPGASRPEGRAVASTRLVHIAETRLNLPHRTFGLLGFTPGRFHVLLNSLFKVLFNFPSRYLFAIGLVVIFSLRWSLPPA